MIIAAQDAHPCSHGPYTGSVSCQQLVDDQIHYVILGHSERRSQFQETDQVINAKIHAAIKCGLTVIFCFGETLTEYENNMTPMVLKNQVQNGLANLTFDMMKQVILAYEPVWAIGTGKTATTNQAQSNIKLVRDLLADLFGAVVSEQTRILYGGSVNLANVVQLVYQPDIDGALVGGASLNPDDF